jgi:hypothetical protein
MSITSTLPGLDDVGTVDEARGIVGKAGIAGLCLFAVCYGSMLGGLSKELFAIPLFLSLCWCITMLGMTLLLDARRAYLSMKNGDLKAILVISFCISGVFLCIAGTTGGLMACWNILIG